MGEQFEGNFGLNSIPEAENEFTFQVGWEEEERKLDCVGMYKEEAKRK
jgi:hypothetical protein